MDGDNQTQQTVAVPIRLPAALKYNILIFLFLIAYDGNTDIPHAVT